jgi:hypothetical protein
MAKPQRGKQQQESHSEIVESKEQQMPVGTGGKDAHRKHGRTHAETTPRDITGINPDEMKPIDPRMVYIPPA